MQGLFPQWELFMVNTNTNKRILPQRETAAILIVLLMPFVAGCASCMSRVYSPGSRVRYYQGVDNDVRCISGSFDPERELSLSRRVGLSCISLIDMPFSAVLDTILLPYDMWVYEIPR